MKAKPEQQALAELRRSNRPPQTWCPGPFPDR